MRNPEKEWRRTSIDQFLSSDPEIRERTEEKKQHWSAIAPSSSFSSEPGQPSLLCLCKYNSLFSLCANLITLSLLHAYMRELFTHEHNSDQPSYQRTTRLDPVKKKEFMFCLVQNFANLFTGIKVRNTALFGLCNIYKRQSWKYL